MVCALVTTLQKPYSLGTVEELFDEEISERRYSCWRESNDQKRSLLSTFLKTKWSGCSASRISFIHCSYRYRSMVYRLRVSRARPIKRNGDFRLYSVWSRCSGWHIDVGLFIRPCERPSCFSCLCITWADYCLSRVLQNATSEFMYLASLFIAGFLVFGPQLLIGVAAVGLYLKKQSVLLTAWRHICLTPGGDSFAWLGLGMIADGTPIFDLTGWKGTFTALDTSAAICIVLLLFVAVAEEERSVTRRCT